MPKLPLRTVFCLVLVAAVCAAYANSLGGDFLFDDIGCVLQNPTIVDLGRLDQVLFYEPQGGRTIDGRPLVNLTLAVNYSISGLNTWSYHVFNLLVHVINVLLAFELLRTVFKKARMPAVIDERTETIAFWCALFWGCHPLTTNAVSYVIQRAESLGAMWILLSLVLFQQWLRSGTSGQRLLWLLGTLASAFAGGLTKETTAVIPLLMLCYWWMWRPAGGAKWKQIGQLVGLVVIFNWIPVGVLNVVSDARGETAGATGQITPWVYLLNQGYYILKYMQLTLFPWPIAFDYGRQPLELTALLGLCSAVVFLLLLASLWLTWRRSTIGMAICCSFIVLGPSSSLIPVQTQIAAEHRAYLASLLWIAVGVCSVVWLISIALRNRLQQMGKTLLPAAVMIAGLLMLLTLSRNTVFASNEALWTSVLQNCPENARAMANLAK